MNKSELIEKVSAMAGPVCESCGCALWDVEYIKEGGAWFLRVFIDKEGGVAIDDCEAVSRLIDPMLDEQDLIEDSYTFEVSSAGIERQLKRPSDFQRFIGSYVYVKLYQGRGGRKEYYGHLVSYDEGRLTIKDSAGDQVFEKGEYALARLAIEF